MRKFPWALWGSDGEGEEGEGEEEGEESSGEESKPETRTLTSEELEAMTSRAASRAGRSATKKLREELGFESVDDLKAFIAERKKADEEAQTEQEKATAEAAEETAKLATERGAVANERLSLAIERQIVRSGVSDDQKTSRISTMVRAELEADLEEEDWTTAITEAIEAIKGDMPEAFTGKKSPGSGDGGGQGPSSDKEKAAKEQAAKEAQWAAEYAARGFHPIGGVPPVVEEEKVS